MTPAHDNLPAAFLSQILPGDITPSANVAHVASYVIDNLTDGDKTTGLQSSTWASVNAATATVTLTFPSANVAGIILNWGWANRSCTEPYGLLSKNWPDIDSSYVAKSIL